MIQIKNINKTFNKGKSNEIKAIKQTSLTLPKSGLVILLGPSGSGKTTLLNVLGGLEYVDSGEIIIGDEVIKKHNNRKLDSIRNEKIGYIFQQYNLLPNSTVYENIELVLKMLGITDAVEIEKRINYVLEAVGMFNFRKRKVSALSGGQQQRVGIARAIAKNPEMVIADEPTGNLDSKNTVEIMNIIKKISEQKLVVLVTHERNIAEFYADRIIEINDGVVGKDYLNEHQNSLDIKHNNTIYLKDLKQNNLIKAPIDVNYFSESDEVQENISVTLITHNDSLYIKVNSDENLKIRYVEDDSEIEILDEHFKGIEKEDVEQNDFDFEQVATTKATNLKKGSVIKTTDVLKYSFKKIKGYSKLQKLMFLGFVFAAMTIAVAIALIGKVYNVDPTDFQRYDKHYIQTNATDIKDLEKQDHIDYINPLTDIGGYEIHINQFYQVDRNLWFMGHPTDYKLLNKDDIIIGRYPKNPYEVVIDKRLADNVMNNPEYKQAGMKEYKELLNLEFKYGPHIDSKFDKLKIVGISDVESPTIWMDGSTIYELVINRNNYDMNFPKLSVIDKYENIEVVKGGSLPKKAGEVLYPDNLKEMKGYEINTKIKSVELNKEYTIVGFYKNKDENISSINKEIVLTTNELLKDTYYEFYRHGEPILVYSNDLDATVNYLQSKNNLATKTYEDSLEKHKKGMRRGYYGLLIFAAVMLGISLLQLYFIIRSSLINRIYEIGVYRSLGATRWDIYKMFIIEILVVTTITSLIGYAIMTFIIKQIEVIIPPPFTLFYFPTHYIIGGVILIYAINIFSGLFPVYMLTRKSPSQILKHYDA